MRDKQFAAPVIMAAAATGIAAGTGFLFPGIGLLPGAIIGAGIGLAVASGPPLFNSALAYFSGQP
ncbi:hypothetical protein [Nocardia sp. CA-290969]|uniref:hypothetical protein n=1 Tax=Nocardia sp. CA-290969 TaxID=3239986 RepID=UPI003D89C541